MFKISKLNKVNNEKVSINLITHYLSKYEKGKVLSSEAFKTLSFNILGDDYSFSFDLNCKLEDLLKIPMNKTIDFKDYILDGETMFCAENLNYLDPKIDIKITRYLNNKFIIFLTFYVDYSYSGIIEFTFNLDDYYATYKNKIE